MRIERDNVCMSRGDEPLIWIALCGMMELKMFLFCGVSLFVCFLC